METMKKSWKPRKGFTAREWGKNLFLFSFADTRDRDWVLKNQPWHFEGFLFAIKPISGTEQPSTLNITESSFWIRVYDLPVACMNEKTIQLIAKQVGSFEAWDPSPDSLFGKSARCKVAIDITKPLVRGITIKLKGESLWIPLKYEGLPVYCYGCGLIGHHYRACDNYDSNDAPDPSDTK
ncbi:hypothetical protein DH2020_040424 [Rehmannia glutinosa]|uniref:CCHC-type domain-containing protein n=1 Tax=Rehmannia glutinosa TaxID=99300 RepID=A0ABR0USY6_REHGL